MCVRARVCVCVCVHVPVRVRAGSVYSAWRMVSSVWVHSGAVVYRWLEGESDRNIVSFRSCVRASGRGEAKLYGRVWR